MDYITEQIFSTEITTLGAIFKLLLSLCLGALIGSERRHKGQAAGMRHLPSLPWVPHLP